MTLFHTCRRTTWENNQTIIRGDLSRHWVVLVCSPVAGRWGPHSFQESCKARTIQELEGAWLKHDHSYLRKPRFIALFDKFTELDSSVHTTSSTVSPFNKYHIMYSYLADTNSGLKDDMTAFNTKPLKEQYSKKMNTFTSVKMNVCDILPLALFLASVQHTCKHPL